MKNVWLASGVTGLVLSAFWTAVLLWSGSSRAGDAGPAVALLRLEEELRGLEGQVRDLREALYSATPVATVSRIEMPAAASRDDEERLAEMLARLEQVEGRMVAMARGIEGVESYLRYGGYEPASTTEEPAQALLPMIIAQRRALQRNQALVDHFNTQSRLKLLEFGLDENGKAILSRGSGFWVGNRAESWAQTYLDEWQRAVVPTPSGSSE